MGADRCSGAQLLRIYWYDAPPRGAPTLEQTQIAELDDTKLRLGFLNAAGEQKGVDSLIVTDLIELARQKSICDAVLLAGDEDLRVGVQVAKTYGVRVHLLGVAPARSSQSPRLRTEADTTTEWEVDVVSQFLSVRRTPDVVTAVTQNAAAGDVSAAIRAVIDSLTPDEREALRRFCDENRGLPPEHDGALLRVHSAGLGRSLSDGERRELRQAFRTEILSFGGRSR